MILSDWEFDRHHIWHPYTSMLNPLPCYQVISAQGVALKLQNGSTLVDGMSSWWAAIHGYNHPTLNQALTRQIDQMAHVMFGGITHPPAITLSRQLINLLPSSLGCLFFADSGSVAVEVALKMAFQYWQAKGEYRPYILSFRQGYHGDTLGAMSVCDPDNTMHHIYQDYIRKHCFAPAPHCRFHDEWQEEEMQALTQLFAQNAHQIGAVIIEPIVQGAGGMHIYHPNFLKHLRQLCDQYQILLIADEIATGFGRTGKYFAIEWANIQPDIMCLGKALTGGYMTFAVTCCTRPIADTISQSRAGCLMHGPTFMANPLACAVASASLELLSNQRWQTQVKTIEIQLWQGLMPLKDHAKVRDVRVLGAIGIVELIRPVDVAKVQKFFVSQGVWIRPFGRLIYLMPPFIIRNDELEQLINAIHHLLLCDDDTIFK